MAEQKQSDLAEKLDQDVNEFVAQLKPKKYEDGWPEDKWEEEMEKHPIFMSKPLQEGQDMPPLVEALQKLKYDPVLNTPEELAKSYKDDGTANFRLKRYRWAVESYTHGLEMKCKDAELNAQLHLNRAAAHYHIGNFQKALKDAESAKVLNPNYMKAIQRGAQCCWVLGQFKECLAWCEEGLKIDASDKQLHEIKVKADLQMKKIHEAEAAKLKEAKNKEKERVALLKCIKERGICLGRDPLKILDTENLHPEFSDSEVHLDEEGNLVWPVLLLYPEHGVTDFIQQFNENSSFKEHVSAMFNKENKPSWDKENTYHPDTLQIYFRSCDDNLISVNQDDPLKKILSDKRLQIADGVPAFFVTVKNSPYDKHFTKDQLQT